MLLSSSDSDRGAQTAVYVKPYAEATEAAKHPERLPPTQLSSLRAAGSGTLAQPPRQRPAVLGKSMGGGPWGLVARETLAPPAARTSEPENSEP